MITIDHIKNFLIAFIRHIEDNFNTVDNDTYSKRILTCFGCEQRSKDWKCNKCGCLLNIKAKWRSENCPEGRWELPVSNNSTGSCGCNNIVSS